jgi:hypothetical protein
VIDLKTFSEGLLRLAVSLQKELDKYMVTVYYDAICDETKPEEWLAFTKYAVKEGYFEKWMPDTTSLKEALYAYRRQQIRALPAPQLTDQDRDERRQEFRKGYDKFWEQVHELAKAKSMTEAK